MKRKTTSKEEDIHLVGDLEWDGLHRPQIYYAVAATFCGLFLSVLDGTICNVALPSMAAQLDVPSEDSIWIVNAFQLAVMMLLLPFYRDLLSRRTESRVIRTRRSPTLIFSKSPLAM